MSRITEELLKKRAEHNDMRLTNLEEVLSALDIILIGIVTSAEPYQNRKPWQIMSTSSDPLSLEQYNRKDWKPFQT